MAIKRKTHANVVIKSGFTKTPEIEMSGIAREILGNLIDFEGKTTTCGFTDLKNFLGLFIIYELTISDFNTIYYPDILALLIFE
jgi:hypothetical protein